MSNSPLDLLTEADAAAALGKCVRTLKRWRAARQGPPYVRVGGMTVCYRIAAVQEWLASREVDPARSAAA